MKAALVVLYVLALFCEGWGLWVIVKDIRKTTDVFRQKSITAHQLIVHDSAVAVDSMHVDVITDPPTVEQRLASIEAELPRLRRSVEDAASSVRSDLRGEITANVDRLREQFQSELAALANTVQGALYVPDPWVRWQGPVALGVGLVLGAFGNIWSALASA